MFIESCEVQLSSAIVVFMLQYLVQSEETCTEHEHTTEEAHILAIYDIKN